jgi:uncharacterized protein
MKIEFDQVKDRINRREHDGLSLGFAEFLDWENALVWLDERFSYDEIRMVALSPSENKLYYVAFVDRGEVRRVISLRYATRSEVKKYVESF